MASSGKVTGKYSNNDDVYISLEWEVKSQDKEANKTTIHCELWLRGKDSYRHWNFYDHISYITVDGVKKTNKKTNFDTFKNPCKLMSADFTVKHNASGAGDFKVSAKHYSGVAIGTATISSKSFTLPTIKRVSKLNSLSIVNEYKGIKAGYTKYSSSFSDTLVIKCKTFTKSVSKYKSGNTVSFTASELSKLEDILGSDKTITFSCYLKTYSGSAFLGNSNTLHKSGALTFNQGSKVYIKTSQSTISKVKGVYIKPGNIYKVKNAYLKTSSGSIVKS